jgi:hypothetical protein
MLYFYNHIDSLIGCLLWFALCKRGEGIYVFLFLIVNTLFNVMIGEAQHQDCLRLPHHIALTGSMHF